jgi:hypothetical protein
VGEMSRESNKRIITEENHSGLGKELFDGDAKN